MKTKSIEEKMMILNRLEFALQDCRNHPTAYPILARFGYMERTANGFKSIDPDAIRNRIREVILNLD
jgi:hypothetical protein